jgi:hypothetical protein
MMAGAAAPPVRALEDELRTLFISGFGGKDVVTETGLVGGIEVVWGRCRAAFEGQELWYQGMAFPHDNGALLILGATLTGPDSASYNLLKTSLLAVQRTSG